MEKKLKDKKVRFVMGVIFLMSAAKEKLELPEADLDEIMSEAVKWATADYVEDLKNFQSLSHLLDAMIRRSNEPESDRGSGRGIA